MIRPGISSYFAGFLLGASLIATAPALAESGPNGVWQVQGTGRGFPWVLEISAEGATITGRVKTCASAEVSSNVDEGRIEGNSVTFKCTSGDGARIITFKGTLKGDEIAFIWDMQVPNGRNAPPGDGMFGATAPRQFTARRVPESERSLHKNSASAITLQRMLDEHKFVEFAAAFPATTGLTSEESLFFRGILAYRQGRFGEVPRSLSAAVNMPDYSLTSNQIETALETLGDTATKTFQYGDAVRMYDIAERAFAGSMPGAVNAVREKRAIAAAFQNAPAQTVQVAADFSLTRTGLEYPITVAGKPFSAVLDTGAAFSTIAESAAQQWGVTMRPGNATLHGFGGVTFSARPALIPVLRIGGAEFRNVAVFVAADKELLLSKAILGYPVTSALGRLTFAKDGTLTVGTRPPAAVENAGAPIWTGYSFLLLSLNSASAEKDPRTFVLDTGSLSTFLTDRYLAEHRSAFSGPPSGMSRLAGAGGVTAIPAYPARDLPLWFGSQRMLLNGPNVLSQPLGSEAGNYFGLIGQDVLRQFSSYTIDYRTMRFSVLP